MPGSSSRRPGGPGAGARCRPPALPDGLEPLDLDELEGIADDDEWSDREVRGAAMAADAARVAFTRCRLVGVRLAGARLARAELTDVELVDCDLAGTVLEEATLVRVAFTRCRFVEADLGGATLTDVRLTGCQLDEAGLRMVASTRLVVEDCGAPRLDLYRARAPGSRWREVDLTGADLSGADLTGAHLSGVTLVDVRGGTALKGTVVDEDLLVPIGLALVADAGITLAASEADGG